MASTRDPRAAVVRNQTTADRVVQASALLGERQSVEIEYKGQHYRLQTTKAGKLILTK
jgi:hemin uptake protein HemP